MTKPDKPLEIVFAEGCFDNFDGTQEELDELVAELRKMVADGTFFEKSQPVSEEDSAVLRAVLSREPRQ